MPWVSFIFQACFNSHAGTCRIAVLLIVGTGLGTAVIHDQRPEQPCRRAGRTPDDRVRRAAVHVRQPGCAGRSPSAWALGAVVDVAVAHPVVHRPATHHAARCWRPWRTASRRAARVSRPACETLVGLYISLCHAHGEFAVDVLGDAPWAIRPSTRGLMARSAQQLYRPRSTPRPDGHKPSRAAPCCSASTSAAWAEEFAWAAGQPIRPAPGAWGRRGGVAWLSLLRLARARRRGARGLPRRAGAGGGLAGGLPGVRDRGRRTAALGLSPRSTP